MHNWETQNNPKAICIVVYTNIGIVKIICVLHNEVAL